MGGGIWLDGFGEQLDAQVGRKLWDWNSGAFPGVTARPKLRFSHLEKDIELGVLGSFINQIAQTVDITTDDVLAIRKRSGFMPESSEGEIVAGPGKPVSQPEPEITPPQVASQANRASLEAMSRKRD